MITEDKSALFIAISLAGLAGFVDALGFLELGGFFISFMSGNSTRFAVGFSEHGLILLAALPLALITLFVMGVIFGALVYHFSPKKPVSIVLGLLTALLVVAATASALGFAAAAIICMVVAMGVGNNIFVKGGQVQIGVTYMTGTLVKLGQKIALKILGKPDSNYLPFLLLWMGLVSGAVSGSISYSMIGLSSLWIAAGFAAIILVACKNLSLYNGS